MIYFVSDAHLGSLLIKNPREHEMKLVRWLESVRNNAEKIYLMGDIFDFWFEYKTVVPKGFVRLFGKLAEMTDAGIEIHFFIGNHDIWTFDYLEKEIGLIVHRTHKIHELHGKRFFLAHGDGLETRDNGFKILRKIFHSRTLQKLFMLVPPRIGQTFGYRWSKSNRLKNSHYENKFPGEKEESLVVFAKENGEKLGVDFFVFGHRHYVLDLQIQNKKRVVILGDFVDNFSFGCFDGENFYMDEFQ